MSKQATNPRAPECDPRVITLTEAKAEVRRVQTELRRARKAGDAEAEERLCRELLVADRVRGRLALGDANSVLTNASARAEFAARARARYLEAQAKRA